MTDLVKKIDYVLKNRLCIKKEIMKTIVSYYYHYCLVNYAIYVFLRDCHASRSNLSSLPFL